MAGRGRGRGKTVSFDVQALGFGRGEALPAASAGPPPLFPLQEFKPVPLQQNGDWEYMLALKQEFCSTFRKSPFYIKAGEKRKDIERYSDKYQLNHLDSDSWTPDWNRLPVELKIKEKKIRKSVLSAKPNIPAKTTKKDQVDISKTLETLEKKEGESTEVDEEGEKEEGEKDEDEEVVDDDEVVDEDDLEEETDYAMSYFDNGEGYEDNDDGDDEGPVY